MKLTKEELNTLQGLNADYTRMKSRIGELEVQKSSLLSEVNLIRAKFAQHENELIKKYGEDSVINMQTGEVKRKE